MELTEKQEKAIKDLEKLKKGIEIINNFLIINGEDKSKDETDIIAIDTVINLINKLKSENYFLTKRLNYSISKEKIEKEIKALKEERTDFIFIGNTDCIAYKKLESNIKMLEKIYYEF